MNYTQAVLTIATKMEFVKMANANVILDGQGRIALNKLARITAAIEGSAKIGSVNVSMVMRDFIAA